MSPQSTKEANPIADALKNAQGIKDQIVNKQSPEFRTYYTNNTSFMVTPFDFQVIFGEMLGMDDGGKMVVEQGVKIIMSALHAKIFLGIMLQNLKQFEEQFGEIKLPPDSLRIASDLRIPREK